MVRGPSIINDKLGEVNGQSSVQQYVNKNKIRSATNELRLPLQEPCDKREGLL